MCIFIKRLYLPILYLLLLPSCLSSNFDKQDVVVGEGGEITITQAREFFEQEFLTRNDDNTRYGVLLPGDFTPIWDEAIVSQNHRIASVDVPIIPQYTYKAICSDYRLGKATAYAVTVSQKLIVVKSLTTGELSHYVMSLIPDKEFAVKHKGNISNIFLNANDRGSFSGIVLYTHNGCPVTVNKYVDGVYTEGTTICGIEDDVKRVTNLKKIVKYISTIRFKRCIAIHSRTGEDNGILDEEDWEYGDEDEYIYITGGIYADEDGNLFIDLDGDGKIDGVYIPPVDVSPEDPGSGDGDGDGDGDGGEEPPTGQQDPTNPDETENDEGGPGDNNSNSESSDNLNEYYEELGQMGLNKIRSDLESGNVQIKQADIDAGKAILYAANIGTGGVNGIIASCLNFMKNIQNDVYAAKFGQRMSIAGAISGTLQTIIVCTDGDITTGDALTAISTALGIAAVLLPTGMAITGIVGVSSCVIGLVSTFVTTSFPSEIHIQLEDGTNVSIYIVNSPISPIIA